MKTNSAMERIDELSQNTNRLKIAFWLLLGYAVLLSVVVYSVQSGLWMAHEATLDIIEAKHKETKLPCSSEINENCEIFVK